MRKVRESNFEIMRIISMFFIVIYHFLAPTGGGLLNKTTGNTNLILQIIFFITIIHVNSFIILSGYFQYKQSIKVKKILSLFIMVYTYKIIIFFLFYIFGGETFSKFDIIRAISPLEFGNYWFIKIYLLLYLSTPIINNVIKNMNEKTHRNLLIILFIIFSVISTITDQRTVNNTGFSLIHFIYLYFIGAYFAKYSIYKNKIIKKISKKKIFEYLLLFFIIIVSLRFVIYEFCIQINNILQEGTTVELLKFVKDNVLNYQPPLLIVQSIIYFLIFTTFSFKNNIINTISGAIFGVYLITENEYIVPKIYKFFGFSGNYYGSTIIFKVFIYSVLILLICSFIEIIRKKILKIFIKIKKNIINN